MVSSEEEALPELSTETDEAFPAVDIKKEWKPSQNTTFEVDPISSQVTADMEIKEAIEKKKREKDRCESMETLNMANLISAAIVAVAGAAFAITKKLKEK